MDQYRIMILIAVSVAVALVAVISYFLARKRRSQQLRERFGPEYDRQFTTVCLLPSHARRIAAALLEAANQAERRSPE